MDRHIHILSPGGYTWNNKGDAGLVFSMIDSLRRENSALDFVVLSDTPTLDSKKYGIEAFQHPYTETNRFIHLWQGKRARYWCELVCFFLFVIKAHLKKWRGKILNKEDAVHALFSQSDLVVFVPGGYFLAPHASHTHWFRHLSSLCLAKLYKKRTVLYACSIGPFVGFMNRLLASWFLNYPNLIILREGESVRYLKEVHIHKPRIEITTDTAFLLNPATKEKSRELFKLTRVSLSSQLIGFAIRSYDFPKYLGEAKEILLEKYLHTMAGLLDYSVEELHLTPCIVPQHLGKGDNDIIFSKRIIGITKQREKIQILDSDYSPQELKGIYGLMSVFVGVRMHANIFALAQRIPTLAIAYEPKTRGIMSAIGLSDYVIDIYGLDLALAQKKLKQLVEHRQAIIDFLDKKLPSIFEMAQRSAKLTMEYAR